MFAIVRTGFGICLILSLLFIAFIGIVLAFYGSSQQQYAGTSHHHHHRWGFSWWLNLYPDVFNVYYWTAYNPFFAPVPRWRRQYDEDAREYHWLNQIRRRRGQHHRAPGSDSEAVGVPEPVTQTLLSSHNDDDDDFMDMNLPMAEPVPELGFLDAIFSVVFGDGSPRPNRDDRWKLICAVIGRCKGIVPAELIAPYVNHDEAPYAATIEWYMQDVMERFKGSPHLVQDELVVYVFPQFLPSHHSSCVHAEELAINMSFDLAVVPYLDEAPWQFSLASTGQIQLVMILGVCNLFGILWAKQQFDQKSQLFLDPTSWVHHVLCKWIRVLLVYGYAFLLIPVLRWISLRHLNAKLEQRNDIRESFADQMDQALDDPDSSLNIKLNFAEHYHRSSS